MQLGIWLPALFCIALLWSGVAAVMQLTEDYVSSPEKVVELLQTAPWRKPGSQPDAPSRRAYLEKIAQSAGLMSAEQRDELRADHGEELALFYLDLSPEEQQWFAQKTVEPFYQAVWKAFNAISPDERRKIISSARQRMKRSGKDLSELEQADPQIWERLAQDGLGSSYDKADARTKLLMGPLLEELQRSVQFMRR